MTNLLISVKPHWAEKIASGEKTWELRKVRPRDSAKNVIIYATSPVSKIVCIATLDNVICTKVGEMLLYLYHDKNHACISELEFLKYYRDKDRAYVLVLSNPQPLDIPLLEIRELKPNFHPPQSYIYLDDNDRLVERINCLVKGDKT